MEKSSEQTRKRGHRATCDREDVFGDDWMLHNKRVTVHKIVRNLS